VKHVAPREDLALDAVGTEDGDGSVPARDVEDAAALGIYFLRSTARCSCCLVILERPSMPMRLASL
jgi:hypothetical protein